MKNTLLIFSIIFLIFSCEKDTENENFIITTSLIGEWSVTSISIEKTLLYLNNGEVDTVSLIGSDLDYNLVFTVDSYSTSGSYLITSETIINGFNIGTETFPFYDASVSGNYTISGSVLTAEGSFIDSSITDVVYFPTGTGQEVNYTFSDNGQTLTCIENETNINSSTESNLVTTTIWSKL